MTEISMVRRLKVRMLSLLGWVVWWICADCDSVGCCVIADLCIGVRWCV